MTKHQYFRTKMCIIPNILKQANCKTSLLRSRPDPEAGLPQAPSQLLQTKIDIKEESNFSPFLCLPFELQLLIWKFAATLPRLIEVWGCHWIRGRQYHNNSYEHDRRPNTGWAPFFSIHPLIHTCHVSREVYRQLHLNKLPDHQKDKVKGKHWVLTSEYMVKSKEMELERPSELVHWLNFDVERDIFFDNGTTWELPFYLHESWVRCGIRRLACDVRMFYNEVVRSNALYRDARWYDVHWAPCIKEVTLVLTSRASEYPLAMLRGWPVDFVGPDQEGNGMSVEEREEMEEYRELTKEILPKLVILWPEWTPPVVNGRLRGGGRLWVGQKRK